MKIFLKAFPFLHKPINKLTNGSNADDAFQNCSRARCHAISINHALCSGHQISLTSSCRGAGLSSWELQRMVTSFSLEKMAVKVYQIGVTLPSPPASDAVRFPGLQEAEYVRVGENDPNSL